MKYVNIHPNTIGTDNYVRAYFDTMEWYEKSEIAQDKCQIWLNPGVFSAKCYDEDTWKYKEYVNSIESTIDAYETGVPETTSKDCILESCKATLWVPFLFFLLATSWATLCRVAGAQSSKIQYDTLKTLWATSTYIRIYWNSFQYTKLHKTFVKYCWIRASFTQA